MGHLGDMFGSRRQLNPQRRQWLIPQGPLGPRRPSTQCGPYPNCSGARGPATPKRKGTREARLKVRSWTSEGVVERKFKNRHRRGSLKENANSAWGALAAKTSKCLQNGRCRTRFRERKNSKPKHGFGGCKVLPKATVPSEGSLKGNCMHEATMPSELVVERKCYA